LKKVAEEVLPEIEKFLESPQERRLRGIRTGIVTSAAGLGGTVFFLVWGLFARDMFFLTGLGVTAFLIGVGLILNALLFTVPKQHIPHLDELEQRSLGADVLGRIPSKREAITADPPGQPPSVTEQTTHHLPESHKPARMRESG